MIQPMSPSDGNCWVGPVSRPLLVGGRRAGPRRPLLDTAVRDVEHIVEELYRQLSNGSSSGRRLSKPGERRNNGGTLLLLRDEGELRLRGVKV
jgi:hypothetical protein